MKRGSVFFALNSLAKEGELPARIPLLPAGPPINGRDGRWYRCSDPAAVIARTLAEGVDLSVDEVHLADVGYPVPAPAYAWLSNLTVEPDGSVWADAAWTPIGATALQQKAYRYISPAFTYDEQSHEIGLLVGAALTNRPNFRMPAVNSQQKQEEDSMKKIAQALGLPEDSTEDQILVALNAKIAAAGQRVDLAAYAPRADLAAMETRALNAETRLAEQAKSDLTKRAEAAVNAAVEGGKNRPGQQG